jgi:alpha-beta hydrolase superfamily lysophospholipase
MTMPGISAMTSPPARSGGMLVLPEPEDIRDVTLEHGEAGVPVRGGVTLYVQWWRPVFPARGIVTIVHGLKDHSARYGAFAERLVARGFAVHAFDLRGHARSQGRRAWVDSFDDYVDDLEEVVVRARGRDEDAPFFVFGHAMGATIALSWALRRSRRWLAGVVVSGATLQSRPGPPEARSTRWMAALAPTARIYQLDVRRTSRDRGTVEDSLRDALVSHAPAPARTAKELLDAMARIDANAEDLEVPLLAMHGGADLVSDVAGSRRLVARAGSIDKQLYVYDALAHDLLHEPERARVARDAGEWLDARARV